MENINRTAEQGREARLIGERIFLRPIGLEDTERIIAWRNQERVRKNFIYQKPFTKEGHEEWMRTQVGTGRAVQFIICEKEDVYKRQDLHLPYLLSCLCRLFKGADAAAGDAGEGVADFKHDVQRFRGFKGQGCGSRAV